MSNIEEKLWQWHVEHYGDAVDLNVPATYRKLLEEVGELGEALMNNNDDEAKMEAGDCCVLLLVILRGLGQTVSGAMEAAMAKLESRRENEGKP